MQFHSNTGRRLIGVLAALLLSGCLQTTAEDKTRFYLLSALPDTTAPIAGVRLNPAITVDVAKLRLPQYLQRPEVVTRVDTNRLVLSEFDLWGGSLEKNMTRVLAANLSALLSTSEVHIESRRRPAGIDAAVEIEVMQFERTPGGRSVLEVQWRVFGPERDKAPLASKISRFTSAPVSASPSVDATVAAMSALIGDLSVALAQAIADAARP